MNPTEKEERADLVTPKDLVVEEFLQEIFDSLSTPLHTPAVELARLWKEEVQQKIASMSITLSHKTSPLVQIMLEQRVKRLMDHTYITVESGEQDLKTMVCNYAASFDQWVDCSSSVSFKATNTQLLGKVTPKDAWILTFYAFATSRRTKDDNLLMLGLVGCSTSGKSTLFESILMEGSHVTTNEPGVGRFSVGAKPVLLFHDIPIKLLVDGKDVEKIKTIARTEPTVAKVHSTTITLPPLFLFYSSNERLMTHEFNKPEEKAKFGWKFYGSQALKPGQKRVSKGHLTAVQNRFIEAFVRQRPAIDPSNLPKYGGFQRIHGVLGLFPRVISILAKYDSKDFHSPYLYLYVLKALCRYAHQYSATMKESDIKTVILEQVFKLVAPEKVDEITRDL